MTALMFFLFSLFIPNVQSCLVIRHVEPPKCNCPVLALDSKNIKSQVGNHEFYPNISSRPIIAPIVSIDDCYGTVYCEGDYSLVVFDTKTATNFGEYVADGLCDRYTQTWLVDDLISGGFTTFQRLYATCMDYEYYDSSCKQTDPTPLLLAYSNDLDPSNISGIQTFLYPYFSMVANVRFDTQKEDPIEYHYGDTKVWENAIRSRLPDPSLSFTSKETGSDVLKVIEKFLDTTEYSICGAKISIIMKRYPNEVNIGKLVQKLRRSHISIEIYASTSPSGGYQKDTLYNLAAQTNGFCSFDDDDKMPMAIDELDPTHARFLAYAVNRQISGKGIMELPSMTALLSDPYYELLMSFQDTVQSFPYSHVTLRWGNNDSSNSTENTYMRYGGTEHGQYEIKLNPGVYKFWLEYNYADDKVRTIQIRLLTDFEADEWVPYDN